jgi:hypothetical protein
LRELDAVEVERFGEEVLDLESVLLLRSGGDRRRRGTTSEVDATGGVVLSLAHGRLNTGLNVGPRSVVDRLLLHPVSGRVGVAVEVRGDEVVGEGRELLDTRDGNVLEAALFALGEEGVVNLTRAEDVANDLFGRGEAFRFRLSDVTLEVRIRAELLDRRASLRVTKEVLREEDDEGLAVVAVDLTTEGMAVKRCRSVRMEEKEEEKKGNEQDVGGNGGVDELHVAVLNLASLLVGVGEAEGVVVAELEETLDTGRGMFGTLTVITVRKRHDETGTLEPLALSGSDELVDHDLSTVGEVTDCKGEQEESVSQCKKRKK